MVVIILENAAEKLRGILTRWMIEAKPGIFVGTVNAVVRERLWDIVKDNTLQGALLIYSKNTEQGYCIDMCGEPTRSVIDLDGLQLIKRK